MTIEEGQKNIGVFLEAVKKYFHRNKWSYTQIANKLTEITEDEHFYTEKEVERLLKMQGSKNFVKYWKRLDDLSFLTEIDFALDASIENEEYFRLKYVVNSIRELLRNVD